MIVVLQWRDAEKTRWVRMARREVELCIKHVHGFCLRQVMSE